MKLKYAGATFDIHPRFAPTVSFKTNEGSNQASTIQETWDIEGSFKKDGYANLTSEWDTIIASLRKPGQDFYILDDVGATVFELKAADCLTGPTCTILNVTEKLKGFLVTNIQFHLIITAEYENPDAPSNARGELEFSFRFDSMGFMVITESGMSRGSNISDPPQPRLSPTTAAFTFESQFDISEDSTECKYRYTWTERKVGLPVGLYNLISSFSFDINEQNSDDFLYNIVRVSGECTLKRKGTAENIWNKDNILSSNPDQYVKRPVATDFIPVATLDELSSGLAVMQVKDWIDNNFIGGGVKVLSKEIKVSIYDQRISFNFQLIKPGEELAKYDYSISIKEKAVVSSMVRIFGQTPVIQRLGYSHSEITERGEIVFFGERPPHPKPFWEEFCSSPSVDYPKPVLDSDKKIATSSIRFAFTYQKDEFKFSDLSALATYRTTQFAFPSKFIG